MHSLQFFSFTAQLINITGTPLDTDTNFSSLYCESGSCILREISFLFCMMGYV